MSEQHEGRTTPPAEIYLQHYVGSHSDADVTWCEDRIEEDDTRYVRVTDADLQPVPCPACGSGDVGGASDIVHCYACKLEVRRATTALATLAWNERAPLIRDKMRLDSACLVTRERDEFGEPYKCERHGIDLRAAIDEAMWHEGVDAAARRESVRSRIAGALHYPHCWDTAAYPTIDHEVWEAIAAARLACSTCAPAPWVSDMSAHEKAFTGDGHK
jgi:hypothetical protein